jgi:hypothetical protein
MNMTQLAIALETWQQRDRSERSEQSNPGSRAAVLS